MTDSVKLRQLLESYEGYTAPSDVICGLLQQLSTIERYALKVDSVRGESFVRHAALAYQRLCHDYLTLEFLDDDILAERYPLLLSYQVGRRLLTSFIGGLFCVEGRTRTKENG
jgi:hypothetical protein